MQEPVKQVGYEEVDAQKAKEEKAKWNSFKGYPLATTVSDGLISQEEKDKLNAIPLLYHITQIYISFLFN